MCSNERQAQEIVGAAPDSDGSQIMEVEHTPIVVDGGSAQIDFSSAVYQGDHVQQHTSEGLFIFDIRTGDNRLHPDTHSPICHTVESNEVCEIVFHCQLDQQEEMNFTITGAGRDAVMSAPARSCVIDFSEDEYPRRNSQADIDAERRVHANAMRKIVGLEIFTLTNGQRTRVHNCTLANGKCKFIILDPHVIDDDDD